MSSVQKDIVLATINARYSHSSFGLRYLKANLKEYFSDSIILENQLGQSAEAISDIWLAHKPKILGVGVYIWNIELITKVLKICREKCPGLIIVLGGPEVSFGVERELLKLSDHIVAGEGELSFYRLVKQLFSAGTQELPKFYEKKELNLSEIQTPYHLYTDEDIKNRKIYVEASRGCAFKCQFCLSSLDQKVRNFNIDKLLEDFSSLIDRGVRQFKFVDRTFNLDIKTSVKILDFFLKHPCINELFFHFELIPDRLPLVLRDKILQFPEGSLQFEVGIQSLDGQVSKLIERRQDKSKALENLLFLSKKSSVHLHVDLIIGLPGASKEIFSRDLNELVELGLQEIQIGILKNLKGTPISIHTEEFKMIYSSSAPYEIIQNVFYNHVEMEFMKSFAKFWDKFFNSGNFPKSIDFVLKRSTPFEEFYKLTAFMLERFDRDHSLSLESLAHGLFDYLTKVLGEDENLISDKIYSDYCLEKGRKTPQFLKTNRGKRRHKLLESRREALHHRKGLNRQNVHQL